MDKLHKRILQAIPIGSERPRPRREIEQMLGMSKRSVERAIERLVFQLRVSKVEAVDLDRFHEELKEALHA